MDVSINELLVGIVIGVCGYIVLDIKSYIDDYIKPSKNFYSIIEDLYLNLRFKNLSIHNLINKVDLSDSCIPNYFKYSILVKDYEAIESIIVIKYLNFNDDNFPIKYNVNRFLLIGSLFALTLMVITLIIFLMSFIIFSPIDYIHENISLSHPLLYYSSLIGYVIFILCILLVSKKIPPISFGYFYKYEYESSYNNRLNFYKKKYKKLCKDGYSLKLNINQNKASL